MKRENRLALCKLLRGDARRLLSLADPFINPLETPEKIAHYKREYLRVRKMHSQFASQTD